MPTSIPGSRRKEPETASATAAAYRGHARTFLAFLGPRADAEIARLGAPDILAFRKAEAERVSPTSVNIAVKFLRMVFEQARRDGLLLDNPAEGVSLLKKTANAGTAERRPFTLPELGRLLSTADEEWRSLILCGFYTGARIGNLARLTWANVDLERGELRFVTGKTGRRQILPLAVPLRRHLETLPAGDDPKQPLHPRAFGIVARQGKSAMLSRQFRELMADAGLLASVQTHAKVEGGATDGTGAGKGRAGRRQASEISFHALRHTATSLMKNAGISPAIVGEFVGHESEAVNRNYTHIGN